MSSYLRGALASSLVLHAGLLAAIAVMPPWQGSQVGDEPSWSAPIFLSSYEKAATPADSGPPAPVEEPASKPSSPSAQESLKPQESSLPEPEAKPEPRSASADVSTQQELPADSLQAGPSPGEAEPTAVQSSSQSRSSSSGLAGVDRAPRPLEWGLPPDREGDRRVEVRLRIGIDGRVKEVQPVDPHLDPEVLREIRQAVKTSRFVPAMQSGKPVEAWYSMTFVL